MRWELPERGLVLPSDFIPLAEETNLIIQIGEWVLERFARISVTGSAACRPRQRVGQLSLRQLRQRKFLNDQCSRLRSYEVSPTSLELEITETTLMEDPERTFKSSTRSTGSACISRSMTSALAIRL